MLIDGGWKKHNSGMFREKKRRGCLDRHGYGCPPMSGCCKVDSDPPAKNGCALDLFLCLSKTLPALL
jgi:hypothetical protein